MNQIRYLILFDYEKSNAILKRIKYLISENSGFTNNINHSYAGI